MSITNKGYLKRKPTLWRWEDDGDKKRILFITRKHELTLLNPVSAIIYASCDGDTTKDDIVEYLSNRYASVPRQQIEKDVESFLKYLLDSGQLEVHGEKAKI
jgi:hypothetical protein